MSQSPVGDLTAKGYEPPRNVQFSIFLDNRVGKLFELLEIFDEPDMRIVAISIADSADYAVVRLVTNHSNHARKLLRSHQVPYSESEILVVELGKGQKLTKLCMHLLSAEINIHYAYPLMVRPHGAATIAIHTDDQLLAGQILRRKLFNLLGERDLSDHPSFGDSFGPTEN